MEIIATYGNDDLASVFVAKMRESQKFLLEFVDSIDPRYSRKQKQCIIVSTQYGCPVNCLMCETGNYYYGNLNTSEIMAQIDFVMKRRHISDDELNPEKLKIHFARMGEPSFNHAVLDVLEILPEKYKRTHIMPCISTIAPHNTESWFYRLAEIKEKFYTNGKFQLQFSINSTDSHIRDKLMPVQKWNFKEMAEYVIRFFKKEKDRKVSLNFAMAEGIEVDPKIIARFFNPEIFMIKLTPINPTAKAKSHGLNTILQAKSPDAAYKLVNEFKFLGFDVIVSIGEAEEIKIGSNCGQLVMVHKNN